MKPRILIVDDDPSIATVLRLLFSRAGYEVEHAPAAADALDKTRGKEVDLVLLDLNLGSDSWLELLPKLKALQPEMGVIVVTAHGEVETVVEAMKLGADNFVVKPPDPERLLELAQKGVEAGRLRRRTQRLDRLRQQPHVDPGGQSPAMRRAVELAAAVAPRDTTVLLFGETGSGKGVLARYIHEQSPRASGPFVELNCAGLQRELTESELFGYEKGAFTGAVARKLGLFEAADGGTLFLDEIGEMDLAVQAKLLKVLESHRFRRMGGMVEIESDVRLLAATHQPLEAQAADGRFRSDLLYRLNVFSISLPPLRARGEDIVPLARRGLAEHGHRAGFTAEAERLLRAYDWPGNVRELRNVIERATILARPDETIDVDHLPPLVPRQRVETAAAGGAPAGATLEAAERVSIERALENSGGSILGAAKALGIARGTLYRKIKKYGLTVPE
jgi:DNA-binding NtrC family response regulator